MTLITITKEGFLERAQISLVIGIILFLIGFVLYKQYKKKNYSPQFGIKRKSFSEYISDSIKLMTYNRTLGLIFFGIVFLILSVVMFIFYLNS